MPQPERFKLDSQPAHEQAGSAPAETNSSPFQPFEQLRAGSTSTVASSDSGLLSMNNLLGAKNQGDQPTSPLGQLEINQPVVSDQTSRPFVQNGVLHLEYGSPNMDRDLSTATNYSTIEVDGVPPGVYLHNWANTNGYFFWFQNGSDNGAPHAIPPFAQSLVVNGQIENLDQQRLQVAQEMTGNAFQSLTPQSNVLGYLASLSQLPEQTLQIQQNSLASAVANSSNPYFKIYLADVLAAQALKPYVAQLEQTGTAYSPNAPQAKQALSQSLQLIQATEQTSNQALNSMNKYPQANNAMPLDSNGMFPSGGSAPDYYSAFAGAYYQSLHRQATVQNVLNSLQVSSFPKITFPLPPIGQQP